jgi:peptidoglycan/xylan/chitin deacetylase (PgdA/CDA1 family)
MAARLRSFLTALVASLLTACATAPPPPPASPVYRAAKPAPPAAIEILARNDDYLVVIPRAEDTLGTLAHRYLGAANRAWWIADFNGVSQARAGVDLVIPLKPSLLNSVDSTGVRTLAILCYHRFDNSRSKLSVSARDFAEQMQYLAANGYHVVPLKDVPALLRGEAPMPPKAVAITIDDGFRSTFETAYPILLRHRFPATVFLYSDMAELPAGLKWAQMKEMIGSGLIDIQPHSKTHANLAVRLPEETDRAYVERLRQEIEAPSSEIERRTGQAIYAFAYPYGDANDVVTELIKRRGISVGLTVSPGGNPFFAYPFLLRRTMIYGDDGLAGFRSKLAVFSQDGAR